MPVSMVNIRKMRVIMANREMQMRMTVWLVHTPPLGMLMLMMLIVRMAVRVFLGQMLMGMAMLLGEMQPNAEQHKRCRQPEQRRHRLPQHSDGDCRSQKRCCRKVRPGSRRAQAS